MGTFSIWHWVIVIIFIIIFYKFLKKKKISVEKKEIAPNEDKKKYEKDEEFTQKTKNIRNKFELKKKQAYEEENEFLKSRLKDEELLRDKRDSFEDKLNIMSEKYKDNGINLVRFPDYVYIDKDMDGYVNKLSFELDFTINKTQALITAGERFNNIKSREMHREGIKNICDHIESLKFEMYTLSGEIHYSYSAYEKRYLLNPPELPRKLDDKYVYHTEKDFKNLENHFNENFQELIVEQCSS